MPVTAPALTVMFVSVIVASFIGPSNSISTILLTDTSVTVFAGEVERTEGDVSSKRTVSVAATEQTLPAASKPTP